MNWQFVAALTMAIPIIIYPAVFVWYLNASGIYSVLKEARRTMVRVRVTR